MVTLVLRLVFGEFVGSSGVAVVFGFVEQKAKKLTPCGFEAI